MSEPKDSPSSVGFFQTLPGIITGLAALITAIGGFLIILSKTGCLHSGSVSHQTAVSQDTTILSGMNSKTKKNTESKSSPMSSDGKISLSVPEIKNIQKNVVYKIEAAVYHALPNNQNLVSIKIKCINNSGTASIFYLDYIRLKIGEDKYKPDDSSPTSSREITQSNTFTPMNYYFKIPANEKQFTLIIYDGTDEIGSAVLSMVP